MKKNTFSQKVDGTDMRFGIVVAHFNRQVTEGLERACIATLKKHGVKEKDIELFCVPGSFEIPFFANELAKQKKYDAIIALGAVVKGETKHDEYIANAVAQGITRVGLDHGIPVIFGVITPNTIEQAIARSSDNEFNKGREAALAAIEMVQLTHALQ